VEKGEDRRKVEEGVVRSMLVKRQTVEEWEKIRERREREIAKEVEEQQKKKKK